MYDLWKSWKNIGTRSLNGFARQLMIIDISLLPRVVKQNDLQDYLHESGFLTGTRTRCLDTLGLEKPDLNEQRTLRQRDLLVVWITASNTPEPVKAALRSVCNSVLVRRPLHAARLKELFQQVAQEGGDTFHMSKLEKSTVILSSNVIHYAKQQEWDDPYDCKTELPYAPLTNHEQQLPGQQPPAATAEEDSSLTASKENLASGLCLETAEVKRNQLAARVLIHCLDHWINWKSWWLRIILFYGSWLWLCCGGLVLQLMKLQMARKPWKLLCPGCRVASGLSTVSSWIVRYITPCRMWILLTTPRVVEDCQLWND
jgi:hypothetical protein